MQWTRLFLAAATTVIVASAAYPSPALADEDSSVEGNPTGGGWDPGTTLYQDQAELNDLAAKLDAADDYLTAKRRAYASAHKNHTTSSRTCNPDPSLPCPTPEMTIPLTQVAQSTNFYCGPAAGVMIMRSTNQGNSAYNGATLTQVNMASDAHMKTDTNGKTAWASGYFRTGINRWRGDSFYVNLTAPTNQQFKSALASDIDRGYTFGVSTVELIGGPHYNFHPSTQEIGHWITAHGYADSLATTKFADPAANSSALSSAWSSVNPKFTGASGTFNQTYVQSNGITW